MKKYLLLFLTGFFIVLSGCKNGENHTYQTDFENYFEGYEGAFVLYDVNNRYYIRHNEEKCDERYSPCSTFKVFNSLAALESGVLKDENEVIKWDSTMRDYEVWNRDHDMRSAIANSVVWFYQEVARRIGSERMQKYLDEVGYGNKDISGGIDKFWLMSSLKISPNEQVEFLRRLYLGELPFSQRSMDIVKDIIRLDSLPSGSILSGKTGSGTGDGGSTMDIGWFIGSVQLGNNLYIFATNIRGPGASGKKAKEISLEILKSIRVL